MKTTNLRQALERADAMLGQQPEMAIEQANEILQRLPKEPNALRIKGMAQRLNGDPTAAEKTLEHLIKLVPDFALAYQEFGLSLAMQDKRELALKAMKRAVSLDANLAECWRVMGDLLEASGEGEEAQRAHQNYLNLKSGDPALVQAANCLFAGKLAKCEKLCRETLRQNPNNVSAIRMLAEVGLKIGQFKEAEKLLNRCLQLAPEFHLARNTYAQVLFKQQRYTEALIQLDLLLVAEANSPHHKVLKASVLVRIGEYDQAIELYEWVVTRFPGQAKVHLSHGHALKTVGKQQESIAAYRRCVALQPEMGEAYWSLANLKTFRFDEPLLDAMRRETDVKEINRQDYYHLCFALGKALEDREQYAESFEYYRLGNKARRQSINWDAEQYEANGKKQATFFSREFFASKAGVGDVSADPIFIVGLPRSGSTLLEQILASHSQVEGTMELPDIISISRRLNGKVKPQDPELFPAVLTGMSGDQLEALGAEYLDRTRIQRIEGKPFFIDKMPNNFNHIGLIHLILPNAKIIDARRHPLGCCFSGFKQLFASGQNYTYDLNEIGRYYRDYVALMDHWDQVLPGRILRVDYENVVADLETQVRRLLDYCDLPFEQACLDFHTTDRAVRTASSEQVRQPIYQSGTEQWQHYDEYLTPLKHALADVLVDYPN